jgi:hypothetical protein
MALISSACSSTPRWMLRHDRRFVPPCLRAFHLPSPSALMPGLSIRRCRRPLRATRGDNHRQGLLTPAQSAQVGNPPVQADQAQKALDEACGLPERHAEQNLYRQAGLDRGVTVVTLSAALAGRTRFPAMARSNQIKRRASGSEHFVVGGPVFGLVGRRSPSAHADQLPSRIHQMNPIGICACMDAPVGGCCF